MKAAAAVVAVVVSAVLAGMAGIACAADEGVVYLWVDKNGTPHYEDRPPEGSEASSTAAKEMSLRYKLTDSEAVAATSKRKAELTDAAQLREKQQAEDKAANPGEKAAEDKADEQDKEKVTSEREQGCKQAKERLQKYSTAHRLYKPGPDGQRSYLTDEETDAARADARRTVDEWCGG